jgi:tetratricopeptide (TPR) repeat protein
MAIGTGLVIGYISSGIIVIGAPPINSLLGAALAFVIYQGVTFSRFFGKRRGEFEYEYRCDLIEKLVKKLVLKYLGVSTFINYFQDQFNSISSEQERICQRLLRNELIKSDEEFLFSIYMKLSILAIKDDSPKKEKNALISALELKPNSLIANYRLALYYEIEGLVDDAINHYKAALRDPNIYSEQLKTFISLQVERIKLKGPLNRPPALGARYMSW